MNKSFEERLNQILPRLASLDVLDNRGAGGEIGFWVFDYPPEHKMQPALVGCRRDPTESGPVEPGSSVQGDRPVRVRHPLAGERKLLDKTFVKQMKEGDRSVLQSLRPVLKEDKLAARLVEEAAVHDIERAPCLQSGSGAELRREELGRSGLHRRYGCVCSHTHPYGPAALVKPRPTAQHL